MPEDVRNLVARNLKRRRIAAGLSQTEVAARMGIDRSYLSGLEIGQRNPTIVTLWHAAKAIGVPVGAFFEEEKLSLRRPQGRPK